MDKKNINYLQKWILDKELTEDDKQNIKIVIEAFSEYMVATNPDYLYNKTYLSAFVNDFFNCKEELKKKWSILQKRILLEIKNAGVSSNKVVVNIDRAWISKNNEIILLNTFNPGSVKSNILKYEIEYKGDNGFVVANSINLNQNYEIKIKEDVELFLNKYKEICDDIQKSTI